MPRPKPDGSWEKEEGGEAGGEADDADNADDGPEVGVA